MPPSDTGALVTDGPDKAEVASPSGGDAAFGTGAAGGGDGVRAGSLGPRYPYTDGARGGARVYLGRHRRRRWRRV